MSYTKTVITGIITGSCGIIGLFTQIPVWIPIMVIIAGSVLTTVFGISDNHQKKRKEQAQDEENKKRIYKDNLRMLVHEMKLHLSTKLVLNGNDVEGESPILAQGLYYHFRVLKNNPEDMVIEAISVALNRNITDTKELLKEELHPIYKQWEKYSIR